MVRTKDHLVVVHGPPLEEVRRQGARLLMLSGARHVNLEDERELLSGPGLCAFLFAPAPGEWTCIWERGLDPETRSAWCEATSAIAGAVTLLVSRCPALVLQAYAEGFPFFNYCSDRKSLPPEERLAMPSNFGRPGELCALLDGRLDTATFAAGLKRTISGRLGPGGAFAEFWSSLGLKVPYSPPAGWPFDKRGKLKRGFGDFLIDVFEW